MHIIILDNIQVSEILIGETQNSYIHIVISARIIWAIEQKLYSTSDILILPKNH